MGEVTELVRDRSAQSQLTVEAHHRPVGQVMGEVAELVGDRSAHSLVTMQSL
jgi:hypothetical protein